MTNPTTAPKPRAKKPTTPAPTQTPAVILEVSPLKTTKGCVVVGIPAGGKTIPAYFAKEDVARATDPTTGVVTITVRFTPDPTA